MAKKFSSVSFDDVKWSPSVQQQLVGLGYEFQSKIGFGSFATVYQCTLSRNNKTTTLACKFIDLKTKSPRYREKFFPRELDATRLFNHEYLVRVYEIVVDKAGSLCFIFMQLAKSDLLKEIEAVSKIPESRGRIWCYQIIQGVLYLHSKGWVHRDLKVENMLISQTNDILISDFGFMREQKPGILSETHCGSLAYAAPEVIAPNRGSSKGHYDAFKADTWSVGVVFYVMHTGEMPFDDADPRKVRAGQEKVGELIERFEMSARLKSLIKGLLTIDPGKRLTLQQALKDPWIGHPKRSASSIVGSIKGAFGSLIRTSNSSVRQGASLRTLSSSPPSGSISPSRSHGSKIASTTGSTTGSKIGSKTGSRISSSTTGSCTGSRSGRKGRSSASDESK